MPDARGWGAEISSNVGKYQIHVTKPEKTAKVSLKVIHTVVKIII
jgi:hypothetical protein